MQIQTGGYETLQIGCVSKASLSGLAAYCGMLWTIVMLAAPLPAMQPSAPMARLEAMRVSARVLSSAVASKEGTASHRAERIRLVKERQPSGREVEITILDFE